MENTLFDTKLAPDNTQFFSRPILQMKMNNENKKLESASEILSISNLHLNQQPINTPIGSNDVNLADENISSTTSTSTNTSTNKNDLNLTKNTTIKLITFGTEVGIKPQATHLHHTTFRCHWIPNPSSNARKATTGESSKLRKQILSNDGVQEFVSNCVNEIDTILMDMDMINDCGTGKDDDDMEEEGDDNFLFQFAFSCARGKHRSVSVAIAVGEALIRKHPAVDINYQHMGLEFESNRKMMRKRDKKMKWKETF